MRYRETGEFVGQALPPVHPIGAHFTPIWLCSSKIGNIRTARSAPRLRAVNWLRSSQNFMATQKQIEANRLNAQRSTGPRTPEGKAAVRLNALRHGMRARTVVLPGEDRQEFERLCDILEGEWQPRTATELFYLEQMAV